MARIIRGFKNLIPVSFVAWELVLWVCFQLSHNSRVFPIFSIRSHGRCGDFNNWAEKRKAIVDQLLENLSLTLLPFEEGGRTIFFVDLIDHILYGGLEPISHTAYELKSFDPKPIFATFRLLRKNEIMTNKIFAAFICFSLIFLFLATKPARAKENSEIDFLLDFVATSECTFIRNGKEYPGPEAAKHLKRKYNYAKSRIKTAEIFIEKIASKSSMSKKTYQVRCNESLFLTGLWFKEALETHGKSKS